MVYRLFDTATNKEWGYSDFLFIIESLLDDSRPLAGSGKATSVLDAFANIGLTMTIDTLFERGKGDE